MMNIKKIITTFAIALAASAFYDHWPWRYFLTVPLFSTKGLLLGSYVLQLAACIYVLHQIYDIRKALKDTQADGWEDRQDIKKLLAKRRERR